MAFAELFFHKEKREFQTGKIKVNHKTYVWIFVLLRTDTPIERLISNWNSIKVLLSLKYLGRVNLTPRPCSFSKNVFFRERVNLFFCVTFNIIISHICLENVFKISQLV